jgi:uroporphyrinogen III methyltransferase / synthase
MVQDTTAGTVYLVGAGPGDPGLLTLRGAELLERADAVAYDALTHPALLERAPGWVERFDVGKRSRHPSPTQDEVNRLLVDLARRHAIVVRLKGGDPFVFGRGGEEALALRRAGIPYEIVPGVTSAVGALGYAGIPLTHRGVASSVAFVTGHRARGGSAGESSAPLASNGAAPTPAPTADTVVVFMGLGRAGDIAREFIAGGRPAATPAAVVDRGTLPGQRTVVGTLGDIGERVRSAGLAGPALIVVGEVVRLRTRLAWFREEGRPEEAPAGDELPFAARSDLAASPAGAGAEGPRKTTHWSPIR